MHVPFSSAGALAPFGDLHNYQPPPAPHYPEIGKPNTLLGTHPHTDLQTKMSASQTMPNMLHSKARQMHQSWLGHLVLCASTVKV